MAAQPTWDTDLEGLTLDELIALFPFPPINNTPVSITVSGSGSSSSLKSSSSFNSKLSPHSSNRKETPPLSQSNSATLSPSLSSTSKHNNRLSVNITKANFRASAPGQIVVALNDTIDFITRGCKGDLATSELPKLYELLLQLSKENLATTLAQCYENIARPATPRSKLLGVMKLNEDSFLLKTSKFSLDFGFPEGKECPLNTALSDEVVLSSILLDTLLASQRKLTLNWTTDVGTGKVKFKILPTPPATTHSLTVNPRDGIIKKKGSQSINFNLKVRTTVKLNVVVTIEVEDGPRYFIVVKVKSEKSVFGVPIEELELVPDEDLLIPSVLVTLKKYLYSQDGLKQVGVFRVQGDELETQQIKNQLNTGTFTGCKDANCIASLIKLWFRELPTPLLNNIPLDTLRYLPDSQNTCVVLYNELPEPNKSLMTWLMDLLADAILLEDINKMNIRNLSICVAPNLYNGANVTPADALVLSGKVVNFVSQILAYRYELKKSKLNG